MLRLPPTLIGFAVINSGTFALDLALVSLLHGRLDVPLTLSVTIGYAVAFSLAFVLNKRFNFRSHAPVGPETVRYVGVVAVNFGVVLLGVTTGLAALGVQYQLARLAAGACEGAFMYAAMRWFVFAARARGGEDAERGALVG
ncbi:GtrA family protein [Nocardioides flavescens]|uniref:GtrA family protein n=1 Tax=Nocardioides flavescens TaxID=2691959 RepID=A0A6L7EWA4_9ACTN|nr:GtrA family protein [Nocardioides flavescens]